MERWNNSEVLQNETHCPHTLSCCSTAHRYVLTPSPAAVLHTGMSSHPLLLQYCTQVCPHTLSCCSTAHRYVLTPSPAAVLHTAILLQYCTQLSFCSTAHSYPAAVLHTGRSCGRGWRDGIIQRFYKMKHIVLTPSPAAVLHTGMSSHPLLLQYCTQVCPHTLSCCSTAHSYPAAVLHTAILLQYCTQLSCCSTGIIHVPHTLY